ncbi:hypothetical protein [Arthrobacter sp. ISL-95]|uniref:hypothetical protein n=1 Tax=Arthrobacter sp. ISL-95 TaxID=2819116 RepID=UPI001BE602CE|nr:hypothetical protein [Arthrobacter sp. ISL-95]MBT2588343.1 hypothetical protein [Arthrobacter sp. ISL-95]
MTAVRHVGHFSGALTGLAIGFASAALVLVPWLLTGARLPVQNLWQYEVLPGDMPRALLPVSEYYALRIAVMLFIGGTLAGLAVRLLRRLVEVPPWSAAVGVLVVHSIAIIQSFAVVADGLRLHEPRVDQRAVLYFGGLLGGTIFAVFLTQGVFWLATRKSVSVASLGMALSAVPFSLWIVDTASMLSSPGALPPEIPAIGKWLPAVLVAVVLAWCGLHPLRRLLVWITSLAGLWITPALFTSVGNALGMRVLNGDLSAMREVATEIFPLALGLFLPPTLLALALATVLTGVNMTIRRRRPAKHSPGEHAPMPTDIPP